MRPMRLASAVCTAAVVLLAGTAGAAVDLARWTFESSIPTTAGPYVPEFAAGGITGDVTGSHASGSAAYSNPAGNGSAESYSSNFWSAGDYYQFSLNTTGYQSLSFGWSQTRSSTGPDSFLIELSVNGGGFSPLGGPYVVSATTWSSGTGQPGSVFTPLSLGVGADNAANIRVRITSLVTPGNTGGTNRIDDVFVQGDAVPTPGALALAGLGGLAAASRRRRG